MRDANNRAAGNRTRSPKKDILPRPRSASSQFLTAVSGVLLILISTLTANSDVIRTWPEILAINLHVLFSFLLLIEFIARVLLSFEELHHLQTRYNNSIKMFLADMLYCTSFQLIMFIICSISVPILIYTKYNEYAHVLWYQFGPTSVITSIIGIFTLGRVLKLNCGPLYDSLWIEYSNGLDYGSGMAHSFFHGYLKLVIPKTGTTEKHLQELMQDYEAKHHVKLEFHKMFILIPKSLTCPVTLMNTESSPTVLESSSLAEKTMTVAGVQNRIYKSSVYKLRSDNNKLIYVCAEYATPLKTFKDVCKYNGEHSNYYDKHKNDIVLQFYLTLKKVLKEHDNCTDFCELIFYDDKDENGRYKDVGKVLLKRIKKLKRQMRERESTDNN